MKVGSQAKGLIREMLLFALENAGIMIAMAATGTAAKARVASAVPISGARRNFTGLGGRAVVSRKEISAITTSRQMKR